MSANAAVVLVAFLILLVSTVLAWVLAYWTQVALFLLIAPAGAGAAYGVFNKFRNLS
jgi:hypothetical protein